MDVEFVKQRANPLVVILFVQEKELALFFQPDLQENQLKGLTLFGLRKSTGVPFPLNEHIVPKIFQPVLSKKDDDTYFLQIEPLKEKITVVRKNNQQFIAKYPFKDVKKVGTITDIRVEYQVQPFVKTWFTVNASYRSSKDAPTETLSSRIECPQSFTDSLLAFFKENPQTVK